MAKKKEIQIINLVEIKSETSKTSFFLFNHETWYRRLRIFRREKRVRGDRKLGSNNESRSGKRSNGCAADYAHSECSRQLGHGKDKKGGTDDPCPSASPSGSIPGYPRSLISLPDKLDYGVSSCPPLLPISPHQLAHSTRMANDAYERRFSLFANNPSSCSSPLCLLSSFKKC